MEARLHRMAENMPASAKMVLGESAVNGNMGSERVLMSRSRVTSKVGRHLLDLGFRFSSQM